MSAVVCRGATAVVAAAVAAVAASSGRVVDVLVVKAAGVKASVLWLGEGA